MNTLFVTALAIMVTVSNAYHDDYYRGSSRGNGEDGHHGGGYDYPRGGDINNNNNIGGHGYRGGSRDGRGGAVRGGVGRLGDPQCFGSCDVNEHGTDCINSCSGSVGWGVCTRRFPFLSKCCCFPLPNAYERCTVATDCDAQGLYCPGNLSLECDYVSAFTRSVCACVNQSMDGYIEVQRPLKAKERSGGY